MCLNLNYIGKKKITLTKEKYDESFVILLYIIQFVHLIT